MKKLLSIVALVITCSPSAFGEDYIFRMLDASSGLPDNNVRNMTMLPSGMMSIQTSSMLNLYNGATCRSYRYNPLEIPYNEYSGLNNAFYDSRDNVLWCTNKDHTWVFDLTYRRFEYNPGVFLTPFGIDGGDVGSFFLDKGGNYWVVTAEGEMWRCDRSTGRAEHIELMDGFRPPVIMAQRENRIWMLSLGGVLAEYDTALGQFLSINRNITQSQTLNSSRMDMVVTSEGNLWIMYDHDLVYYDVARQKAQNVRQITLGSNDIYTTIAIDRADNLWVGSARSGVSIIDTRTMRHRTLPWLELPDGTRIYHHTDISKIYIDDHGGVWIATLSEGLLYWHKDIIRLDTINDGSLAGGEMSDESVKCMVEDVDGTLLVGTIRGLLRYDPETRTMSVPWPELSGELCISLFRDSRDRIWLGTFHNGAFCIEQGHIRHYIYKEMSTVDVSYHDSTPNFNCVRTFYEDTEGQFWISVYGGLGRFDPDSGEITLLRDKHPELKQYMIVRDVCDLGDGTIMVLGDNGRYVFSPAEERVMYEGNTLADHIPSTQALIDQRGLLWIATADGISVVDSKNGRPYSITMENELPNNNILGIATDGLGNVWASTFGFISRIRPLRAHDGTYTFAVSTYGADDGATASAFFQCSAVSASSGNIYFGGAHGICSVTPSKLYQTTYDIAPQMAALYISGHPIEVGEEFGGRQILTSELPQTRHIELRHDESFLTFEFSNFNYANPTHTRYSYKLENFDNDWNEIYSQAIGRATYTFLKPGTYRFLVRAADNDVDWSSRFAQLEITIRPPFWRSTAALAFYIALVIAAGVLAVLWMMKRTRLREEARRRAEQQQQQEEIDQMKFRFFTNISHELRTPLSLIILPLEGIMRKMEGSPLMAQFETMHRNVKNLLSLVNHLLDFRKLEMGGERLHLSKGDIGEFIGDIAASFRDAADKKGIGMEFDNGLHGGGIMFFDSSQLYKITNNLLSNALKFTSRGGFISVRLSKVHSAGTDGEGGGAVPTVLFEVSDTGSGIPAEDIPHIFDRFYQSGSSTSMTEGTGIGLCLVKQYAEMHSGSVTVESEVGKGSVFRVRIPMTLVPEAAAEQGREGTSEPEAEKIPLPSTAEPPRTHTLENKESTPKLLIIDDNVDFRTYMVAELSSKYIVSEAEDGTEGLRKAHKLHPDIIVCDVMMPQMDGFELTRRLKNDIETSHIPIILLTARMSDDTRREGYLTGGDAYITKPFNMDVLEARIQNLLEERCRRISRFSSSVEVSPTDITVTTIDEKLMTRIMECMERNIDNTEYSVEELSSDVGMHRMNLYRKLQSIAGMTPSEFMRTMRLKRAAALLQNDPNLTMTEVSEMAGFNTTKYFTRYFREMFGLTPSQYAAQFKK